MMNVTMLCQRAEQLWHAIAPRDLGGTPVYVVPVSALPEHFGLAGACHGYTTPSLDLYLQPTLGPGWRGRGAAAVINDIALANDWADAEDFELAFLLVALHELAHVLERDQLYRARPDASPERLIHETLVLAQAVAEPEPAAPQTPPFQHHGDSFIRTCIHVSYRANHLNVPARPSGLCAGSRYGLSPAYQYGEALGDEPEQLAEAKFRDILARPLPDAFVQLWNQDVTDWETRTRYRKEKECLNTSLRPVA